MYYFEVRSIMDCCCVVYFYNAFVFAFERPFLQNGILFLVHPKCNVMNIAVIEIARAGIVPYGLFLWIICVHHTSMYVWQSRCKLAMLSSKRHQGVHAICGGLGGSSKTDTYKPMVGSEPVEGGRGCQGVYFEV